MAASGKVQVEFAGRSMERAPIVNGAAVAMCRLTTASPTCGPQRDPRFETSAYYHACIIVSELLRHCNQRQRKFSKGSSFIWLSGRACPAAKDSGSGQFLPLAAHIVRSLERLAHPKPAEHSMSTSAVS